MSGCVAGIGCLCGTVRVRAYGACACSLRSLSLLPEGERHPISLFAGYRIEWRVLEVYRTSPGVRRSFCGDYEMPLLYENERLPGEVSIFQGGLR